MPRMKRPVNNSQLPDHVIESIARILLPDIQSYYDSKEGQQEFENRKEKKKAA